MNEPCSDLRWHQDAAAAGMSAEALLEGARLLEAGRAEGRHAGAQVYVGRHGQPVVEYATGEAAPGRPMRVDDLAPWLSASKPVTALAVAMLLDRGLVGLDDRVADHLPGFGAGKEACTVRHVLTHQGGFPGAVSHDMELEWDEVIERVRAHPAEFEPGSKAAYHPTAGWYVLGEILRRVDGRPIERFVAEEIFGPLGAEDCYMGVPAERLDALGDRMVQVQRGRTEREHYADESFIERWNGRTEITRVNPSGGIRGPARGLGLVFDLLLQRGAWQGRQLVDPRTVELFTACHRWGLPDLTLNGAALAWGLGFALHGSADLHRDYSRRVFSHSGMVSTVALGDPVHGVSCVVLTTGLLDPMTNARRLREVTGTALHALRPE